MAEDRDIALHRMVLPEHTCPFGLLAKRMLEDAGLAFEDHLLTSREEVEAFKEKQILEDVYAKGRAPWKVWDPKVKRGSGKAA